MLAERGSDSFTARNASTIRAPPRTPAASSFALLEWRQVLQATTAGPSSTLLSIALPDRKSVVQGKSVSVRVDLGGRRNIKKKTKHHTTIKYNQQTTS